MWYYPEEFDVIVVGAGHAGCEAAHAAAKMGMKTLLTTMSNDSIAKMSCNPAIGGTAKGHIVREIDALGGIMGQIADRTGIQFRMLNRSKGPAVWSPRCQSDRYAYAAEMKKALENTENLHIFQATTHKLLLEEGQVVGIQTQEGISFRGKSVILTTGTFMSGTLHIGEIDFAGGRAGDKPSYGITEQLAKEGFTIGRLKTGTPPRLNARSIDFSVMEEQPGEEDVFFSYERQERLLPQISCWITYTTLETKEIALKHLNRSAMYSGKIKSVGPRYCPSFEDKVVRFSEKERHQIFLEPEGVHTNEFYVNGISTSLPFDVQLEMIHSIPGLEKAEITRPAYAIQYDYFPSGQIDFTLETKKIKGLYFAGQVNGTTGYEEAAAQGIIAGINAALKIQKRPPFILKRSEAYIGVLIEDVISKELKEPYRMFTSRAEHRLLLREDNADLRLRDYGYSLGLINQEQYERFKKKKESIEQTIAFLKKTSKNFEERVLPLSSVLSRPETSYADLQKAFPHLLPTLDPEVTKQVETALKYEGYIERQRREIAKLEQLDEVKIPHSFDFSHVKGLRRESLDRLLYIKPQNLGQASRLEGVTFADISILLVALSSKKS